MDISWCTNTIVQAVYIGNTSIFVENPIPSTPNELATNVSNSQTDLFTIENDYSCSMETENTHCIDCLDDDEILKTSTILIRKCSSYTVKLCCNIYLNFPFQLMQEIPHVTFENGVFHDNDCLDNNYMIFSAFSGEQSNGCCTNLEWNNSFKKVIDRNNSDIEDPSMGRMNNKTLTHSRLVKKVECTQSEKRELRLRLLNATVRNSRLCGTLALHQRFLVNISEQNIPRLQQLLSVALRK